MSNVKSGKHGFIKVGSSDLAEVQNWRFSQKSNNKEYASSSTAGHNKTVDGNKSGSVSFQVLYDQDDPIWDRLKTGDQVSLELYHDETHKHTVPVRIESMDDEVRVEEGGPPTVAVEAQTHGAWTFPDSSVSS